MRFIDDQLKEKWNDGSIPKRAKGELVKSFHEHFGYTKTSNTFSELMTKKQQPTPEQDRYLCEHINAYWDFYNPSAAESSAQTSQILTTKVD